MNNYSRFNDSKNYRAVFYPSIHVNEFTTPVFSVSDSDYILNIDMKYIPITEEALQNLSDADAAIIEEVARSKYLTTYQIWLFLGMRGISISREKLYKRILFLAKRNLLIENEIRRPHYKNGLKYFEVSARGGYFAVRNGVILNKATQFMTYKERQLNENAANPVDVKRILAGNQCIIGLLLNSIKLQRFGIMETLRVEVDDKDALQDRIMRTASIAKIDDESILCFEVVRNTKDALDNLSDKIIRYYKILQSTEYLQSNHHDHKAFPQLIICGESFNHNIQIFQYLSAKGLINSQYTILFTDDILCLKETNTSLYGLDHSLRRQWYSLPVEKDDIDGRMTA